MAGFGRDREFVPVPGVRRAPKQLAILVLTSAAAGFLLSAFTPLWLGPVVEAVGPLDCTTLIPKLERAPGRYEPAAICEANTRLWIAFWGLVAINLAAFAAVFAPNLRHLTLDVVSGMSWRYWLAIFIFLILGVGLFWIYLHGDLGAVRRRYASDLEDYRDVLAYARDQVMKLGAGAALFLSLNVVTLAAVFIRRRDLEA